ncbi:MAG: putative 2OG-Fe(II) oxygenase [Kangiellaceae bacterium]|jgi:uncharacterized protein (TIGR02466 family)|nr:putative 2OG-Fe(II) oxygenase [Kangiellaceae bacterium]
MPDSTENSDLHFLWPTPFLRTKFADHKAVNSALVKLFVEHRKQHDKLNASVYSSSDDLLMRYNHPELNALFKFISDQLFSMSTQVNAKLWQFSQSKKLQMSVVGAWFQIQNGHGFHETHNHGNCAWSGVYYVQVDDQETRIANNELGEMNGVTRFYGHQMDLIGGGYMDSGNLYLQDNSFDSEPEEGVLCIFPSHLKHMAMPYIGRKDRIIVSFNIQVHGDQGDGLFNHSFTNKL